MLRIEQSPQTSSVQESGCFVPAGKMTSVGAPPLCLWRVALLSHSEVCRGQTGNPGNPLVLSQMRSLGKQFDFYLFNRIEFVLHEITQFCLHLNDLYPTCLFKIISVLHEPFHKSVLNYEWYENCRHFLYVGRRKLLSQGRRAKQVLKMVTQAEKVAQ